MGALAKALMDMPVGELEAAIEGRAPTAADRRKRVRDEIGARMSSARSRPGRAVRPQMQAMSKALVASLPAIMEALGGPSSASLSGRVANLPDPTYPRR